MTDKNETLDKPETTETQEPYDIDTSVAEIPNMGYSKDFENKVLIFVGRGTFRNKPTEMERQNLNKDLLDENDTIQRWYGILDREYDRTLKDGTKIKVKAIQLSKTQNDRLSSLGVEKTIDQMFKELGRAKMIPCKVLKINDKVNKYWTLLTINQYKERFGRTPEE